METQSPLLRLLADPVVWGFLFAYFFPTILAVCGRSAASGTCFLVNLFFGWTLVGWVVALGLASCPTKVQFAQRNRMKRSRMEFDLREEAVATKSPV